MFSSSLNNTHTMPSKKAGSKKTIKSATGDAVEQVSMSLPIYEDTKLFVDKDIKMNGRTLMTPFQTHLGGILETVGPT